MTTCSSCVHWKPPEVFKDIYDVAYISELGACMSPHIKTINLIRRLSNDGRMKLDSIASTGQVYTGPEFHCHHYKRS